MAKLGVPIPPPQDTGQVPWLDILLAAFFLSLLTYSIIQPVLIRISRFSSFSHWAKLSVIAIVIISLAVAMVILLPWTISHLPINERSLRMARIFFVDSKSRDDFNYLAELPCWKGKQIGTLLEQLQFAGMQRQHFYSSLESSIYRPYLLSPMIGEVEVDCRGKLWEYFYPRISNESDPKVAALRVVECVRERIRVGAGFKNAPDPDTIWIQRATSQAGFDLLYIAALRSVGIPARLNEENQPELWADDMWQPAPKPPIAGVVE